MPPARPVTAPQPASAAGTVIIACDVLLLSLIPFSHTIGGWTVFFALVLVIAALAARDSPSLHLALFAAALAAAPFLIPSLRGWPSALLVPLAAYLAVVLPVRRLRRTIQWLRTGRFTGMIALLTLSVSALSIIALYLWYRLLRPDVSLHLASFPGMALWLLPFAGLSFALGNAALEEAVFRGIIMQACDSAAGPGALSLLGQAWLFGAMHYLQGFPSGGWGLVMTVVYGAMLGGIRRKSGGMLAPWAAHVVADCAIFIILAVIVIKRNGAV